MGAFYPRGILSSKQFFAGDFIRGGFYPPGDFFRTRLQAYIVWLQVRTEEKKRDYRNCCRLVKQKVRESKDRTNKICGKGVTECLRENKKMFWKVVNEVRKVIMVM